MPMKYSIKFTSFYLTVSIIIIIIIIIIIVIIIRANTQ